MRILVVEDDERLSLALAHILREAGYDVDEARTGRDGLSWAESGIYDVIVLDVMLPGMDGFSVVSQLRRTGIDTPVLMLTARDSVPDKICGFDSGADDYMTKPFAPAELMAHLRALTRRQGEVVFEELRAGDLTLSLSTYELSRNGKSIHLSQKEFRLAQVLMGNAGAIVSKGTLLDKVWGFDSSVEDNSVEAYISFLRKKLRFLGSHSSIQTVRGAGYRLVAADSEQAADERGDKGGAEGEEGSARA